MEEDFEAELEKEYEKGRVPHKDKSSLVDEEEQEQDRQLNYKKKFKPIGGSPKDNEEQQAKVKYVRGPDGKLKKKVKRKKKTSPDGVDLPVGRPMSTKEAQSRLSSAKEDQGHVTLEEEEKETNPLQSLKEEGKQLKREKPAQNKAPVSSSSSKPDSQQQSADKRTKPGTNIEPFTRKRETPAEIPRPETKLEEEGGDDSNIFSDAGSDYNPSPPPEEEEPDKQTEPKNDYFKGAIGMSKSSSDEQTTPNPITSAIEQLRYNVPSNRDEEEQEHLPPVLLSNMDDNSDGYDIEGFMGGEGKWDDDDDGDDTTNRKPKKRRKRWALCGNLLSWERRHTPQ